MKNSAFGPRTTPLPRGSGFRPRTVSLAPVPFPSRPELARSPWVRTVPGVPVQGAGEVKTAATRKPLASVSAKRARENRQRRQMVADLYPERPHCARPGCPRMADDLHEPLTRARGGSIVDPDNQKPLCRPCHDEVTFRPESELQWAYEAGLLRHSWAGNGGAA